MLGRIATQPAPSWRLSLALPHLTIARATALASLLGFALRLAAARGDLWLDEIWSFSIVAKTASFSDIVFALPHDNNHILNSLWLKLVGPEASSILVRLPAILFGTLCIPVAARLGARISPMAAVCFAVIAAIDYPFVHFGSEARGYSGLILAFLVALDALEARLDDKASRKSLAVLAIAIAFGTFSHPIMLEATALICATAAFRLILSERLAGAWLRNLMPILIAATAGTLPALVSFAVSLASGPLHVGLSTPFFLLCLAEGLGAMVRATIGFWPETLSRTTSAFLLPVAGLGVVVGLTVLPMPRRVLPALGLLAWPAMQAILQMPNLYYARFHLLSGVCLALLLGEIAACGWGRGKVPRLLVLVTGAGFVAGQSAQLAQLFADGRGHFAEATNLLAHEGSARLSVLPSVTAPETLAVMRWYAKRDKLPGQIVLVPAQNLCTLPPDWLIIVHRPDDSTFTGDARHLMATSCPDRFEVALKTQGYGMSGFDWTILKRRSQLQ